MTDARSFAIAAHRDQRYGGAAYETHLAAVVRILDDFGFGEAHRQAGWLHDVVEDTPVPLARSRSGSARRWRRWWTR